jgi:phosphopantetheine adenylyltransferase
MNRKYPRPSRNAVYAGEFQPVKCFELTIIQRSSNLAEEPDAGVDPRQREPAQPERIKRLLWRSLAAALSVVTI